MGTYRVESSLEGASMWMARVMKMKTLGLLIISLTVIALQINFAEASPIQKSEPYDINFEYHNYGEMSRFLNAISSRYQNLTNLYSIGKSVEGRDLWVMAISSNPRGHVSMRPDVKYVGNIHGNEVLGRELLLHFIHLLVTTYGSDPEITWLLDNTRIHILPNMNPDGSETSDEECIGVYGRGNANNVDLNRNFPDTSQRRRQVIQPETQAVMVWSSRYQFILSGSMHGGALVATYPFDNNKPQYQGNASSVGLSPDDDVFRYLASTYSENHRSMHLGKDCPPYVPAFERGITNGATWYPLAGGMQDYNYIDKGCMEITLEVSCCKFPPAQDLPFYWDENRKAIVEFLTQAHRGVKGVIFDKNQNPIAGASLMIKNRNVRFTTSANGEFWRILLPGVYDLMVDARGYPPHEVRFEVSKIQQPTILNVLLLTEKEKIEMENIQAQHQRDYIFSS